ncbi:hypothetical protein [Natrinema sp. SYSU A 869]|uniref:hypothetical protein n=1 Tax=Natrinema sp. SYSU A 869 TaxID=2871694 RepID=UPI001CA40EA4|nr:hypothetical protein [Natrinema sp. SYSU A 869]
MTDRPPSPPAPTTGLMTVDSSLESSIVATTSQLAESIEDSLGYRLNVPVFENLLLELDRHGYVDWVTVTRTGDYVWDLSESPNRIGEAIATAVVDRLESWLASDADGHE